MAGDLNVTWIHGSPECVGSTGHPPIQVHRFDGDTYILRQGKCSDPPRSFEAPFMYLLIGTTGALLLDAGASSSPAIFPLAKTVGDLLGSHATAAGGRAVPLIVAHSHGHLDHLAGNAQFHGRPDTTIVAEGVAGVKAFFALSRWPEGSAAFDLGDRVLDILAIPGHEEDHIAVFDRRTGLLLTGDTVYPGLLVVYDWPEYRRSIARLRAFSNTHTVAFLLGAHIEMTNQPGRWFGLDTAYQPDEHVLQLEPRHLIELDNALQTIGGPPLTDRHADFIIHPRGLPLPPHP
jgi:hydroxyacylglutathione hydrolase